MHLCLIQQLMISDGATVAIVTIYPKSSFSLSPYVKTLAKHRDSAVDTYFEEKARIKAQAQLAFDRKTSRHLPRNV